MEGGWDATLSSWGDKAPAVTHRQQREKVAPRWGTKEEEEDEARKDSRDARLPAALMRIPSGVVLSPDDY